MQYFKHIQHHYSQHLRLSSIDWDSSYAYQWWTNFTSFFAVHFLVAVFEVVMSEKTYAFSNSTKPKSAYKAGDLLHFLADYYGEVFSSYYDRKGAKIWSCGFDSTSLYFI